MGPPYLDNPFGVFQAQLRRLVSKRVADGLARGDVFEGGRARCLAGRLDRGLDHITLGDREVGEVDRRVRVPLVPSGVGGLVVLGDERDARLQDG